MSFDTRSPEAETAQMVAATVTSLLKSLVRCGCCSRESQNPLGTPWTGACRLTFHMFQYDPASGDVIASCKSGIGCDKGLRLERQIDILLIRSNRKDIISSSGMKD